MTLPGRQLRFVAGSAREGCRKSNTSLYAPPDKPSRIGHTKRPWEVFDHQGSGGNSYEQERGCFHLRCQIRLLTLQVRLYNLAADPGEMKISTSERPELVKELKHLLEEVKESGRSRG